ncbi:MAG: sigma-70 family RNA polymerase sigma factor [Verrucomicrobiaceae bacterium]|nr:sigma-70 family RNA polymerase sigma factor [Verrucomicrobiaceae bacterium]
MDTPQTPHAFKPTRWSLVLRSQGQDEQARHALEELCTAYWFPLYAWSRRAGFSTADAEDLVQGFFVQVLQKQLFAAADPELGRLRTFMLTAFRRHVNDEQRRESRQKRGAGRVVSFDAAEAEAWYEAERIEDESADHMFDRQWALTVLDRALASVEEQAAARGKSAEFTALRPFLTGEATAADYERAAQALGMTANAVKVAVHRLRGRFRDCLRAEVAGTQGERGSIDEEMTYLMQVLHG